MLFEHIHMFDFHTLVHHHLKASVSGLVCRLIMGKAHLHPDDLGPNFYGIIHNRRYGLWSPEDVYHIDWKGNGLQVGIACVAQYLFLAGIDRNDPVVVLFKVFSHFVTIPFWLGGQADNGHGLVFLKDGLDLFRRRIVFWDLKLSAACCRGSSTVRKFVIFRFAR